MLRGENIFPKNMISRGPVYIIYVKTDSTVKNREYAFAKTFESVFDEDTFFNSCLQDFTKTFSLTENQFSGKTYLYTIRP